MSYNVDSVEVKHNSASLRARDVIELHDDYDLPESCFLYEMYEPAKAALLDGEPTRLMPIPNLRWHGKGSGHGVEDVLEKEIAPRIRGRIDAILVWEGGDSITGISIRDGKYVTCAVEQRLVLPEGW